MSTEPANADNRANARAASFGETLAVYLKPRVLVVLFLGFSAGLPLALVRLDAACIGPPKRRQSEDHRLVRPRRNALHDQISVGAAGRRARRADPVRGCSGDGAAGCCLSQLVLIAAIAFLASAIPVAAPDWSRFWRADGCDRVGDAGHRHRCLSRRKPAENEQAAGMASYVAAYRVGMLVSSAGALYSGERF